MFFKVNFRYDEPYLPTPRCRKLRHREAQSSVEVDVPCIPKAQAHPVFRVSDYDILNQFEDELHFPSDCLSSSSWNAGHRDDKWDDLLPAEDREYISKYA